MPGVFELWTNLDGSDVVAPDSLELFLSLSRRHFFTETNNEIDLFLLVLKSTVPLLSNEAKVSPSVLFGHQMDPALPSDSSHRRIAASVLPSMASPRSILESVALDTPISFAAS